MNNKQWSYMKPTNPGWYFVNRGDVVTDDSIECQLIKVRNDDSQLSDSEGVLISNYCHTFKFLKVDAERLNTIGNNE